MSEPCDGAPRPFGAVLGRKYDEPSTERLNFSNGSGSKLGRLGAVACGAIGAARRALGGGVARAARDGHGVAASDVERDGVAEDAPTELWLEPEPEREPEWEECGACAAPPKADEKLGSIDIGSRRVGVRPSSSGSAVCSGAAGSGRHAAREMAAHGAHGDTDWRGASDGAACVRPRRRAAADSVGESSAARGDAARRDGHARD